MTGAANGVARRVTAGAASGVAGGVAGRCFCTPGGVKSCDERRGGAAGLDCDGVVGPAVRGAKNGGSAVLRRCCFCVSSG